MQMQSIWPWLAAIPKWVYALVFLLIYLGIKATRPIIVPFKNLFYTPILFITLSLFSIWYTLPLTQFNIAVWVAAALLGAGLGWVQFTLLRIRGIKNTHNIYVPGTWALLLLVLFFVVVTRFISYKLTADPSLIRNTAYAPHFMFLYGIFSGLFMGRLARAGCCVFFGPFIEADAIKQPSP